mmetsp:Transcript_56395/g.104345  ORF Transcript_56395/g.104345 Transcript_56395/m.104345 type:complete len:201 (-) Transcript_56395:3313-3915(-)
MALTWVQPWTETAFGRLDTGGCTMAPRLSAARLACLVRRNKRLSSSSPRADWAQVRWLPLTFVLVISSRMMRSNKLWLSGSPTLTGSSSSVTRSSLRLSLVLIMTIRRCGPLRTTSFSGSSTKATRLRTLRWWWRPWQPQARSQLGAWETTSHLQSCPRGLTCSTTTSHSASPRSPTQPSTRIVRLWSCPPRCTLVAKAT